MAHNVRVQPDTTWKRGYVPKGSDLAGIDANVTATLNGDAGGTWTPTSNVSVGGAGLVIAAPSSGDIIVSAPISFGKGTADDAFGLGASHPGRTRSIQTNMLEASSEFATASAAGISPSVIGGRVIVPLRVYHGSRLISAIFRFSIGQTHTAQPDVPPRFRVFALSPAGLVLPMTSAIFGGDAQGFVPFPVQTTVGNYNTGGPFSIFFDQNNVVDVTAFNYFAEIIDEDGANTWTTTPNTYASVTCNVDSIAILDGRY